MPKTRIIVIPDCLTCPYVYLHSQRCGHPTRTTGPDGRGWEIAPWPPKGIPEWCPLPLDQDGDWSPPIQAALVLDVARRLRRLETEFRERAEALLGEEIRKGMKWDN